MSAERGGRAAAEDTTDAMFQSYADQGGADYAPEYEPMEVAAGEEEEAQPPPPPPPAATPASVPSPPPAKPTTTPTISLTQKPAVEEGYGFWIGLVAMGLVVWLGALVLAIWWANNGDGKSSSTDASKKKFGAFEKKNSEFGLGGPPSLNKTEIYSQVDARVGGMGKTTDGAVDAASIHDNLLSRITPSQFGKESNEEVRKMREFNDSQYSTPQVNIFGKDMKALAESVADRQDAQRTRIWAMDRTRDVLRGNFGPCARMMDFFYRGPYSRYLHGLGFYPVRDHDYEDGKDYIVFGTEKNEASMG